MPRRNRRYPTAQRKPKKHAHKKPVLCQYCGGQALLKEGAFLFGENSFVKNVFVCVRYPECDSYVQAHEKSLEPMGQLANAELRRKRMLAHMYFDKLWKEAHGATRKPIFTRQQAYKWLADRLGGHTRHNHIGLMGEGLCDKVIKEAKRVLWRQQQNTKSDILVEGDS